jgi:protein-disulfide isomerase
MISTRLFRVVIFSLVFCIEILYNVPAVIGEVPLRQTRLSDGVVLWNVNLSYSAKPSFFTRFENLAKVALPSLSELPFERSVAILVGISKYQNMESLPFVRNDLEDMKNYLLLRGGFDQVYVIADEVATSELIETYMMNTFRNELGSRDRLLFYYAGHGADPPGGTTGYLQFTRARLGDFAQYVLPISRVYEWSRVNKAAHMLYLLDTCASGLAFSPRAGASSADLIQVLSRGGSRTVVTAGTAEEKTFELKDVKGKGNGVFTRALLAALENGTGQQTTPAFLLLDEVFSDLKMSVARFAAENGKSLHPKLWSIDDSDYRGSFIFINQAVQHSKVPEGQLVKLKAVSNLLSRGIDDRDEVLAITGQYGRLEGRPITAADVRSAAADKFDGLQREYAKNSHDLLESSLQAVIEDRLAENEASARGISKDQVLVGIKGAPVTDADVDAFYEQNKAQIPRPKEQVAGQIKNYLEQQGQVKARQTYFDNLQKKYKVTVKMEPLRVVVAATGPAVGPATAPVTIVEFSDFQCPFCGRFFPTLKEVKRKYGDKVRFVFRQFPLPFHESAQKAAEASLCADDQGKFWQLHDAMFGNQAALGVDQLKARAVELGLKVDDFNKCLDSGAKAAIIEADKKAGSEAGVTGTPAMYINGRLISGAVPLEQITLVIDDELRRKGTS